MQIAGASSMAPVAMLEAAQVPAPPKEGPNTPKIALGMGDGGGTRRKRRRGSRGDSARPARRAQEDQAARRQQRPWRIGRHSVDRAGPEYADGALEAVGHHCWKPDDQPLQRHPLRQAREQARRGYREDQAVDHRGRQSGPAGGRVQLLRASRDGGVLRRDRQRARELRLDRFRFRAGAESRAALPDPA